MTDGNVTRRDFVRKGTAMGLAGSVVSSASTSSQRMDVAGTARVGRPASLSSSEQRSYATSRASGVSRSRASCAGGLETVTGSARESGRARRGVPAHVGLREARILHSWW